MMTFMVLQITIVSILLGSTMARAPDDRGRLTTFVPAESDDKTPVFKLSKLFNFGRKSKLSNVHHGFIESFTEPTAAGLGRSIEMVEHG
jgi:hypothetical protein